MIRYGINVMSESIFVASMFLAMGGVIYFVMKMSKQIGATIAEANIEEPLKSCEAIMTIQDILAKYGLIDDYGVLANTMILMLYGTYTMGKTNLYKLLPDEKYEYCEIGGPIIERHISFVDEQEREFYSFMTGVVEEQVDFIRNDPVVSYQDKQIIRKMVDVFYYKELHKNNMF